MFEGDNRIFRMAFVVAFKHFVHAYCAHGDGGGTDAASFKDDFTFRLRSMPRRFGHDKLLSGKGFSRSINSKKLATFVSNSSSSVQHPMLASLLNEADDSSPREENDSVLILIRHGESMWNEKNLFTGCVDVPLTERGVEEAIEAGKRIKYMPLDIVFTSALIRSQMTAMLALTEHHLMKVPIILHNENEESRRWSQIWSEDTKQQTIPVVKAWQLNERMYGELQGFNKKATADLYGKDQVQKWRRSYEVRPPNGESLEMCLQRAVAFFKEHVSYVVQLSVVHKLQLQLHELALCCICWQIEPQLLVGKHVMVVAHANSLRSMIMYLDKLSSQEVIDLELSTGVPMLYIFRQGKFIRRGSPLGSSEAGVYAYTESLALYRQQLDEISH